MEVQRKYGAATTIIFPLIDRGTLDFENTPVTFVAADTQISKDEGTFANTGSTPVHEGNGIYSLALTATEMQAARIAITVIDAATKTWEDQAIIISTYGHTSAQDDRQGFNAIVDTTIASVTSTTVFVLTDGPGDNNAMLNAVAVIFDADGDQSFRNVTAYTGSTTTMTVASAPDFTAAATDKVRVYPTAEAATAATIADLVWDELRADHVVGGSFGEGVLAEDINTAAKASINTEVDGALNTAIPGSPTLNSVNERIAAIDNKDLPTEATIFAHAYEGSTTFDEFMRLSASALFGILAGAATTTITVRDEADSKDRITAAVDGDGNRSVVTLDKTA